MKDKKEAFIKKVINKMLEKHNVDFDYVKDNPEIDGNQWYEHFTHTEKDEEELKKYYIKNHYYKDSKVSEKEWSWFNLMWGLKIKNK